MSLRVVGLLGLLVSFAAACGAAPVNPGPGCNVAWSSPSKDSSGSMPLGNGDIAANVWAEPSGDLLFYLSRSDAWDEYCRPVKLGRIRVHLDPSPLATRVTFRQELRLRQGEIAVTIGKSSLRIWIDANRPAVHVEGAMGLPARVTASLETWRTERRPMKPGEASGVDGMGPGQNPEVFPDVVEPSPRAVTWYHRNSASLWPVTLRHQGLGELADPAGDPLLNRTFGGLMEAPGFARAGAQSLASPGPVSRFALTIHCLTARTATVDQWRGMLAAQATRTRAIPIDRALAAHRAWWAAFWDRSWIHVSAMRPSGGLVLRPLKRNSLPLRIGADSQGQNRFMGSIADAAVYKRALTPAEVANLARGGVVERGGLVSRWNMGHMEGGRLPGFPSGAAPLSAVGTVANDMDAPWPDGSCAKLNGEGFLETPHSHALDLSDEVTLAAWIKPGKLPEGGARIIDKSTAGGSDGYLLDTYPGNSLRLITDAEAIRADARLKPGVWVHVAAVFSARTGERRLYVDGKPLGAGPATSTRAPQQVVSQGYALHRFMVACAGRGAYPIKFNGSLFTVDVPGQFNADYRAWGGCYWFQNTRLPYWPMLRSGDFEQMLPLFRMYTNMLPLCLARTRKYFGHGGAFFPETMYFWGAYHNGEMGYGWNRDGKGLFPTDNEYIRYYWSGGLELLAMGSDYYAWTGDVAFLKSTLLPLADAVMAFYDQHYPRDANGKIRFEPSQSLETWWDCVNPTPEIAGMRFVLGELLAMPTGVTGAQRRADWSRLLAEVPPIPVGKSRAGSVIAPAEKTGRKSNMENPELYAIFPYRLFGVGKPGLAMARRTWAIRQSPGHVGWQQDDTQAAYLGLADEAGRAIVDRFGQWHQGSRFPAFWGPNFDWIPDQDHGSNGMMGLQAMLMQCEGRKILLLPAWPAGWDARFRLHAPLSTVVEGEVKGGKLVRLRVTPPARRKDVTVMAAGR